MQATSATSTINLNGEDPYHDTCLTSDDAGNGDGGNVKLVRIRLLGHCIFCLRKTTNKNRDELLALPRNAVELLERVPNGEASPSSLLTLLPTFNRMWPHLQKISSVGGSSVDVDFLEAARKMDKGTTFSRLPRTCQYCLEKLEAVDKLWRELITHVEGLGATMKESKQWGMYWWRGENFEKTLADSSLNDDKIRDILEFVGITAPSVDLLKVNVNPSSQGEDETALVPPPEAASTTEFTIPKIIVNDIIDCDLFQQSQSPSATKNFQSNVTDSSPVQEKRFNRQFCVDIPTKRQARVHFARQSNDIYTSSHDNETSFDHTEDGDQADDESDTEYMKLEPDELSSSDYDDSTDDDNESLSSEEDAESFVAYKNLVYNCQRELVAIET